MLMTFGMVQIRSEAVIVAAGSWSSTLAPSIADMKPIRGQLLRLACSLEARFGFSSAQGKAGPTLLVLGREVWARGELGPTVDTLAAAAGLALHADIAMPANNRCIAWRRP